MLFLILAIGQSQRCSAQTPAQPDTSAGPTVAQDPAVADIEKELAAMKARIEQLEAELEESDGGNPARCLGDKSCKSGGTSASGSANSSHDDAASKRFLHRRLREKRKDRALLGLGLDLAKRQSA